MSGSYSLFYFFFNLFLLISLLHTIRSKQWSSALTKMQILAGVVLFSLCLTIGSLLCWHIYLMCHNMTTIEASYCFEFQVCIPLIIIWFLYTLFDYSYYCLDISIERQLEQSGLQRRVDRTTVTALIKAQGRIFKWLVLHTTHKKTCITS
jgi:hypothetical protein